MTREEKEEKLQDMLKETYLKWIKKYHPFKTKEDYVYFSDGEYDPDITEVLNNLVLCILED